MLAHVYLKKGCVVPKHSHENEQFTYILEGALRFLVGETGAEAIVVRAGEVLHLPSHLPHEAHARSEEHTSELQSPCISYAVFCLKKKNKKTLSPPVDTPERSAPSL